MKKINLLALALTLITGLAAVTLGLQACDSGTSVAVAATISTETTASQITQQSTQAIDASVSSADDSSAVITENSYSSATKTITISKVTTGSGGDTITYYVADVQLSEGTLLQSAFANGTYGGRTEDTSTMADDNDAIVAINGDYYSALDDGVIIRNGVIYRDIPARAGLVIYKDGTMEVYEETTTNAEELLAAGAWNTYSFGPGLVVDGAIVDGVDDYEADPDTRHSIRGTNPRTGIGMVSADHYVFVVVDGRSPGYSRGVTLAEFAQIFQSLGCTTAYNLDGGGSSTLYFMGEVVNDPSQRNGERAVSDILFVD